MESTEISVVTVGHMPANFDVQKIKTWKSAVFRITGDIENYSLNTDADGPDWSYTDENLENEIPATNSGDFMIAIVNIPLQLNYYTRQLSNNRVVFTFHEMKEILDAANIPLENIVYRLLYAYTLEYRRNENREMDIDEIAHDETRGCLFDMNGIKTEVIYSCDSPIICPECVSDLQRNRLSNDVIRESQKEIGKIRKMRFYRMTSFIKRHPIGILVISSIATIILGIVASILGTLIFQAIKSSA